MAKSRKKLTTNITAAEKTRAEVMLFGVVYQTAEEGTITAEQFAQSLNAAASADEVEIRFNSPGGNIIQGIAMMAAIERLSSRTVGIVEGMALSIASAVLQACDVRKMHRNALLMIHSGRAGAEGEAGDLRVAADRLDKYNAQMAAIYQRRSGQSAETVAQWMSGETWFNAEEALAAGLIDEIIATDVAMAAEFDLGEFKVPDRFQAIFGASNQPTEAKAMAEEQKAVTPAAPAPATIQELKQLMPNATAEFLLDQLTSGADAFTATRAYALAMEKKYTEAAAEAARRAAEPVVQVTNAQAALAAGVQSHNIQAGAQAAADPNDNRRNYEQCLRDQQRKGVDAAVAMRTAEEQFPRGYKEFNATRRSQYEAALGVNGLRPRV